MEVREKIKGKLLSIADNAKKDKLKEQLHKDIVIYKSVMPIEMEESVIKLFVKGLVDVCIL